LQLRLVVNGHQGWGITYHFERQRFAYLSLDNACINYYTFKQGQDESLADYLENFQSRVKVLEHYGRSIGENPTFLLNEVN